MDSTKTNAFNISVFFEPWMVLIALAITVGIFVLVYLYRDRFFGEIEFAIDRDEETMREKAQKDEEDKHIPVVIGLALSQYLSELEEYEKAVLTIEKIIKPYSPWSSKIYGLRQTPIVQSARKKS